MTGTSATPHTPPGPAPHPKSTAWLPILILAAFPARAELRPLGTPLIHSGMCEASGAVSLPQNSFGASFAVANDEDNLLRTYRATISGPPAQGAPDVTGFVGIPDKDRGTGRGKADLEAATWLGNQIFWIGSHSRNEDGKIRDNRQKFFATDADLRPTGTARDLRTPLAQYAAPRAATSPAHATLLAAIGSTADAPPLAAKHGGLDIEGLAARPATNGLWIGLRGPVHDGKAMLVALDNPAAIAATPNAAPAFSDLALLDLGGRGIRSMDWSPTRRAYVISAGPLGQGDDFALFTWSGQLQDPARLVPGSRELLASLTDSLGPFAPEAMLVDPNSNRIQLLSDDGKRRLPTGELCEKAAENARSFRSIMLEVD